MSLVLAEALIAHHAELLLLWLLELVLEVLACWLPEEATRVRTSKAARLLLCKSRLLRSSLSSEESATSATCVLSSWRTEQPTSRLLTLATKEAATLAPILSAKQARLLLICNSTK